MNHPILAFKYNWNGKLYCKCFTTLRMTDKYPPGTIVEVQCPNVKPYLAKVIDRKKLEKGQLNDWMARIDTGYGLEETRQILFKMYPKATKKSTLYYHMLERCAVDAESSRTAESITDLFTVQPNEEPG